MPTIQEVRQQYPQYDDLSDQQLADALHSKFYSDMPKADFLAKIGMGESDVGKDLRSELSAESTKMTETIDNIDRARYDALPEWQKPFVAAQDTAALLGDGLTMGFGDKAVAAVRAPFTDKTYEQELAAAREQTQDARNRAGYAGTAAEVVGAAAVPIAAAGRGLTLAGRLGTGAMTGAKGVGARAGLMAAEGAGYGALSAAGHDEDISTGAAIGAAGGAAGSVIGDAVSAGLTKAHGAIKGKPKVPDLENLRTAAREAYDRADNAGVIFKPEGVQRLGNTIRTELAEFGYHPQLQPRVAAVLDEIDRLSQGNTTLKGVDVLRRIANNIGASQDPSEKALGAMIVNKIDDFVSDIKFNDVIAGNPMEGAAALKKARNLWSRVAKNERLIKAVEEAKNRAGATGSGGNVENATRQNIRKMLEKGRGFTADEKAAMQEIVRGTPTQDLLRLAGKLSPSGNGLMAALGIGGTMVNPAIGLASLGGMGAKALADRGVQQGVEALETLIRSGGNAAALQSAQGTLARLTQAQREALARFIMGGAVTAGNQPSQ